MQRAAATFEPIRLTILSDTHERHCELDPLPGGDILIHCGDISVFSRSSSALRDFASWFSEQPYRHRVLCYGNHEFVFEADPALARMFQSTIILLNSAVRIDGLTLWGSPVTPLYGGAFGLSSATDRARHRHQVPADTDILITHGPPFGILDRPPGQQQHQGDPQLLEAVTRVRPILHCFGHVHGAYGGVEQNSTIFINAALLGPDGALAHAPVHLRLTRRTVT